MNKNFVCNAHCAFYVDKDKTKCIVKILLVSGGYSLSFNVMLLNSHLFFEIKSNILSILENSTILKNISRLVCRTIDYSYRLELIAVSIEMHIMCIDY